MMEESKTVLRAKKNARIIESICKLYDISVQEATDMYYRSYVAMYVEDGTADFHCRSDKYLATMVWEDFSKIKDKFDLC